MGVVEQSQETVEEYLSGFEETHRSFPVNQTTITVSTAEYQRERERADAGSVESYAKVENENTDILHLDEDGTLVLPSTRARDGGVEGAIIDAVEASTGIVPKINGIEQATILGINDAESNHETVFRLAVVFAAVKKAGSLKPDAVWHSRAEIPQIVSP